MKIKKSDLVVICDTREQNPLVFPEARVESGTLQTGDYSLKGFEDQIAIERKSLQDLLSSLGVDRERFMREVQRLKAYEYRALVIEASLLELHLGKWRSKITAQSVIGSLLSLSVGGVNVLFAENHEMAAGVIEGLMFQFLRKKAKEVDRFKHLLAL